MKFATVLLTSILAATIHALVSPSRVGPHNFAIRPSYQGRLSGGYDHALLVDGRVQFTTNVTRSDGVVVLATSTCPSWYNKCLNAEPDYAAADGGSTSDGDEWCEDHCITSCPACNLVPESESGIVSSRKLREIGSSDLVERSACMDICDLISVGSRAATLNIRSLVAAAGAAIAKAACYATCDVLA